MIDAAEIAVELSRIWREALERVERKMAEQQQGEAFADD